MTGLCKMDRGYYAHSLPGKPQKDWQRLEDHLQAVVETAREFADSFRAGEWAYLARLRHDVGKCSDNPEC
jgi:CRISPR-associated endonuclease/helicase Cas3